MAGAGSAAGVLRYACCALGNGSVKDMPALPEHRLQDQIGKTPMNGRLGATWSSGFGLLPVWMDFATSTDRQPFVEQHGKPAIGRLVFV
jgi:hypothetical protein